MPDLTEDEWNECYVDYIDEFKNSDGGPAAEVTCRIKLQKLGIDEDEIDYLIRINRP